jgi:hypothetical protein
MEVRSVVHPPASTNIRMTIPKNRESLRHARTLHRLTRWCRANGLAFSRAALAQETTERGVGCNALILIQASPCSH